MAAGPDYNEFGSPEPVSESIPERVINCAEKVFKQLGYGLSETAYRRSLASELRTKFRQVEEEVVIPIHYTTSDNIKIQVAVCRLDILLTSKAGHKIILELKTLSKEVEPDSKEYRQLQQYIRIVNPRHGLLINFSKCGLQIL